MKAAAIEYRLRVFIQTLIGVVAVWAPWVGAFDLKRRISTLEWLALEIGRTGIVSFAVAVPIVIVFGILLAAVATWLRVWGTAYLGYFAVRHAEMQAAGVMSAGPYRYVRNPLYLGGWFLMAAIALLLTPSGALFLLVLTGLFYLRLIFGEESFLAARLGEPYQRYLDAVPRIVPRLRANLEAAEAKPQWHTAIATEIMPIGTLITLAAVTWTYDNVKALEGILISFAIATVVRGLLKATTPTIAFLAISGVLWGFVHLSIERSVLIALGAALVVWAFIPRNRSNQALHPDA